MKLLIVESPAKCKTIAGYLGEEYKVDSSLGHIRDLKIKGKGGFGVDIENNFQPEYSILQDKMEVVKQLKIDSENAEHVYLATDPDREGEAISWHLSQVLGLPDKKVSRIVFNEITKTAIIRAIQNDRQIDMNLVHSQESRRILDRIIGFRLSGLLQQKIGSKSAGRVQSVALKLIVEREKEIEAFDKTEYWDIFATIEKQVAHTNYELKAKFVGTTEGKVDVKTEEQADEIIKHLEGGTYTVTNITKKVHPRASKPPFITSTLQQDASIKFNYNAKRVMSIAQKLYEGIELGKERVGLITYMRTDSVRLSDEFLAKAKTFIIEKYGEKYYKGIKKAPTKGKNVQDAHEAIRPTNLERTPESIKRYLAADEYKLYSLIYNRALASLMADASIENTTIDINNNGYIFNLNGEKTVFDGFLTIYEESNLDNEEKIDKLPEFNLDEELNCTGVQKEQKFTTPPYRYTEARLIRKMEELGIGRPSTYALTMETLRARGYVTMDKRTFVPTAQGRLTIEQLELFFSDIINVKYTADMENTLDKIAEGQAVWYEELRKFYNVFAPMIENARDNMVKIYPKKTDEFCPVCGLPLIIRRGPFGEFTACSGYPHCKFIKKKEKKEVVSTGVVCPVCGEGEIVERVSARGRSKGQKFYACSRFPQCKTTYSGIPLAEKCEICGSPMINDNGTIRCGNEHCKTNEALHKVRFAKTKKNI
ncbi:MAG: type I DNA topoisomerase [Bacilli bacterium]|nr:type I DNA topoisomerase [Bacilli bacterium]